MPGPLEAIVLILLVVFFAVAIKRQWYTLLFTYVVAFLGVVCGIFGVIKLTDDSDTNDNVGIIGIVVGVLVLMAAGFLRKRKRAAAIESKKP